MIEDLVAAIEAAPGFDRQTADMLAIGARATNLARTFNTREGFSAREDTLLERLFGAYPLARSF